ncbi:MAG: cell division protein FtsX [Acidobacteriota bacterium]
MRPRLGPAILADGLRGLARSRALAASALIVIGVTFSVAALALLTAENLATAVRSWGHPDVLRVYLDDAATPEDAAVLADDLGVDPRVASAVPRAPEEIRRQFDDTFPEMQELTALFDSSPFPPEVEIHVAPGATEAVRTELAQRLAARPLVAAVLTDDLWAHRLLDAARWIRRAGQVTGLFFALAAAVVVGGVVRLSLTARRDEIRLMQVVGASRTFIAGPFVVEGLVLGTAGGLLAVAAAWGALAIIGRAVPGISMLAPAGFFAFGQAAALVALAGGAGAVAAAWTVGRALAGDV